MFLDLNVHQQCFVPPTNIRILKHQHLMFQVVLLREDYSFCCEVLRVLVQEFYFIFSYLVMYSEF